MLQWRPQLTLTPWTVGFASGLHHQSLDIYFLELEVIDLLIGLELQEYLMYCERRELDTLFIFASI